MSGTSGVRRLLPLPVSNPPSPTQLAAVAGVLSNIDGCLLPVADGDAGDEGARIIAAAEAADPLTGSLAKAVLAVATTGSTGTPKIVLHSRDSLVASIEATEARLGGAGAWLLCLGINHIAGIQVVLRSAHRGRTPIVCPAGGRGFAAEFAAATAQLADGRRYVSLVPTQLERLLDSPESSCLRSFDAILLGGAAADPALLARAESAGAHVVTTYGMSETGGGCVYDGEPLDDVAVGVLPTGEIRLAGPVVALGYASPTSPNPFHTNDSGLRSFTTSDLGEVSHGRLRVIGRADDLINTGGEKVAPTRVEQALRELPMISDAIVCGVPDPQWGQRVAALLTTSAVPSLDEVRTLLRGVLGPHELPRELAVVDSLPYKGIGKPDRAAAREYLLANPPADNSTD